MADWAARYLTDIRWRNYSPNTVTQRGRALRRFARYLGPVPLEDATTEDLMAFLGRLQNPASRLSERSNLAGFYRWLVLENVRVDDPMARVPKPRGKRWLPRPMPEDDLMRALRQAPERVRPWLYLAAFAGLRASEVAPLRGEHVWWHADPPLILIERSKGGESSTVPIAPILARELRRLPSRGVLFPRLDGRPGPVPAHLVSHLANDYLHSLGIWHTFHSLRHRYGTKVLRASGGNLRQTQELMRHKSIASTIIYTEVDQSEGAAIVAAIPGAS